PTMEGLVAAGFGVAVVPVPRPERAEPGAAYIPLSESSARRQIGLTWNADRPLPPAAERLAEFVMHNVHDID
nr:LysR substrate-binding domain-containing protein [Streptomyces sp. DSM 41633]